MKRRFSIKFLKFLVNVRSWIVIPFFFSSEARPSEYNYIYIFICTCVRICIYIYILKNTILLAALYAPFLCSVCIFWRNKTKQNKQTERVDRPCATRCASSLQKWDDAWTGSGSELTGACLLSSYSGIVTRVLSLFFF